MMRQPKGLWRPNNFLDRTDPLLKQFMLDVHKYPVLSMNEVRELIAKAHEGDLKARNKVMESNYRLVIRIAKEFQSRNMGINDFIQEGMIGLAEAIDKFNLNKGVPFPHFASWYIKMRILKYIWWNQTTVRIPENQREGMKKLFTISTKYISRHGVIPSMEKLMEESGLTEEVVQNYYKLFDSGKLKTSVILKDNEFEAAAATKEFDAPDNVAERNIAREKIAQCLDTLKPHQKRFLQEYYGIDTVQVPVKEMARRRGHSVESIRQRRARLIEKLRKYCSADLSAYLDIEF